jgi:tetratricopeptide (TPR) repeat protein
MPDTLQLALRHHQQGQLVEAARLYHAALAVQPDHPEALHLLGVVAHQKGDHARAVELILRAIVGNPGNATYHANLAEAYRAQGRFEQAIASCRAALRLRTDYPEAANNLGLALLGQGKIDDAVAQFSEALRLKPDYAMACNNLGNALRLRGDLKEAETHFRRAVEMGPSLAEAHSNLGQLLLERRQPHEALTHLSAAVRLRPDLAEAHNNLGNSLRDVGRIAAARQAYAVALQLNPNLAVTYNNMGQALQEENALDEALTWYERALQLDPHSARFHCNLAGLLAEKEKYAEAIARYLLALRLDPTYADAHCGLGGVRHEQGYLDQAQAHYHDALRHNPDLPAAHSALGRVHEELGDFTEAERCWRTALRLDPRQAGAHAQLATLLRGKLLDEDLAAMRSLLADPDLHDVRRSALQFGMAHVQDARGAYAEAADLLRQANALDLAAARQRGLGYDPAEHSRFVAGMMAACTPDFFDRVRGFGLETERPIFIVGLPRSGTTLTEQILASHSQVLGGGELRLARDDFKALAPQADAALQALAGLDEATACRIGKQHLKRLEELNADRSRVVDKMPDNYLYLGLLAALFPRAKFIHCRRDLRDVAVSCWMTNFRHIRWANDPGHIVGRFEDYRRIMQHWRRVRPAPLLAVDYEETVTDLEGVARRLVDWCGLDWEPACLAFHERQRPVRTASVSQVRQPIYKCSVARWKHYERSLESLLSTLSSERFDDSGSSSGSMAWSAALPS